ARKDYKAILGESGGTLPIPHIEKKPEGQDPVEEVSEAERAALAAAAGDLDAVAGECKPLAGRKPTGDGKYDTSERDAERGVIGGLMGDDGDG
ncbi:conjugal transfer protein TraG, partial [Acidithiobacillus ferrooxidans]|nr:conjugal transfer protein TraG [Acidithiobacillus ferrooxidans]